MLTNDKIRLSDLKRQIEIAAMIAERNNYYTKYDLADKFNVDASRIHRDIGDLRNMGVNIHSRKSRYALHSGSNILSRLLRCYVAFNETDAVSDIQPVQSTRTLAQVVALNRAVQSGKDVQILHEGIWKTVRPLGLRYVAPDYCFIAEFRNETALFPLSRITDIRFSGKKDYHTATSGTLKQKAGNAAVGYYG